MLHPAPALAMGWSIPFHFDEPFSDSSQIPTLAIAEEAKKKITVALTGDGGDEVFLGYPRYSITNKAEHVWKTAKKIPLLPKILPQFLKSKNGTFLLHLFLKQKK
jgi:asparagine synthase (glutamine-hydrolysing)